MHDAGKDLIGPADRVRALVIKQVRLKRGIQDGNVANGGGALMNPEETRYFLEKKKSVNAYIIFRCVMSCLYTEYTQAQRSTFIRAMWDKEAHKTSWSLIAKVWTHIRDYSGGFKNMMQFAAGAIDATGVTPPDLWLRVYHMMLVFDRQGNITLRQHHVPTAIPQATQITDVELLCKVLKRGLPVKDPVKLLTSLCRSQKHYIALFNRPRTTSVIGAANESFRTETRTDPMRSISNLIGYAPTHGIFAHGINNLRSDRITSVSDSLVSSATDLTIGGMAYDKSTAHLARDHDGALDLESMDNSGHTFDIGDYLVWDEFSGQTSLMDHQRATDTIHPDADDYNMNGSFANINAWGLQ